VILRGCAGGCYSWLIEINAILLGSLIRSTTHACFADFCRRIDESDPLHLRRMLRAGREWPRSCSTKYRDEIAPPHLIRPRRCLAHCPNRSNLDRSAMKAVFLLDATKLNSGAPARPASEA
jgi:hypothetical protein